MLFQAALYFDEVFVIHPGSALLGGATFGDPLRANSQAESQYRHSRTTFIKRLLDFDPWTMPLRRAGVLRVVPPQMQQQANFIELITADIEDRDFQQIVGTRWKSRVFVASTKMEPFWPLVGQLNSSRRDVVKELERRNAYALHNHRRELYSSRLSGPFSPSYFGVREVDPILAASILLNHAFLLSERHNLVPFTDDLMCVRLMNRKLQRVAEEPGFQEFRRVLNIGAASLSMRVLEEQLPRFGFTDADDVLRAREKLREQLTAFREAMAGLSAEIQELPYDVEYRRRVEQVIVSRVKPAIAALENEIRTSRDGFITKVLRNTQVGTVPVVGSILAGLPASAVIAASAGVLTFEAAIETYMELSRKKRNGFTLLLKKH
jgi:hypothetical protein